MPQRTATCAPWCTDHYTSAAHPEDDYCRREVKSATFGRVSLEYNPDGKPMVFAYGLNADELTLTQAAELRDTLDALIGAAA